MYLLPLSIELFTSNELLNLVCDVSETRHNENTTSIKQANLSNKNARDVHWTDIQIHYYLVALLNQLKRMVRKLFV